MTTVPLVPRPARTEPSRHHTPCTVVPHPLLADATPATAEHVALAICRGLPELVDELRDVLRYTSDRRGRRLTRVTVLIPSLTQHGVHLTVTVTSTASSLRRTRTQPALQISAVDGAANPVAVPEAEAQGWRIALVPDQALGSELESSPARR